MLIDLYSIRKHLSQGKTIFDLPLKVTYYARVSTLLDAQLNSLENQKTYYTNFIKSIPNWTFVEGYIDEGISGTSVNKRQDFLRMIEDAKRGMFNLILTKEISRFSRNTVDSIQYTQELLSYSVGVLFQNDNLNTFDPDAELRLTIMSSIAQEEIRKLSDRVRFGYKRSIEAGKVNGSNNIWGYNKSKGKLQINKEEAEIVRLIFQEYSNGKMGTNKVGYYLFEKYGIKSSTGKPLTGKVITDIIRNPKYKGYYCAHKETVIDYHNKKRLKFDKSDWVIYKDNDNCPPIVSEELWENCNTLLEHNSKKAKTNTRTDLRYALSGKIKCFKDGATFTRGSWKNRKTGEITYYFGCSNYRKYGKIKKDGCNTPVIKTSELYIIFKTILTNILDNKSVIINEMIKYIDESSINVDLTKDIYEIDRKIEKIQNAKLALIDMRANNEINIEEYNVSKKNYDSEIQKLNAKKDDYKRRTIKIDSKSLTNNLIEKINSVILEDEESVFNILGSIINTIYVEKIEDNEDKKKMMLHIKLNILNSIENEDLIGKKILLPFCECKRFCSSYG